VKKVKRFARFVRLEELALRPGGLRWRGAWDVCEKEKMPERMPAFLGMEGRR
jgi:hypothetical protein